MDHNIQVSYSLLDLFNLGKTDCYVLFSYYLHVLLVRVKIFITNLQNHILLTVFVLTQHSFCHIDEQHKKCYLYS